MNNLGRLESVDPRMVWKYEDGDFIEIKQLQLDYWIALKASGADLPTSAQNDKRRLPAP
jgi:hypothetical protein